MLVLLGTVMIATGQPIDEIEDELREVGRHLGAPELQVGAGPTGVHVALATGEPSTFESVRGGLRLDQAADALIRHLLVSSTVRPRTGGRAAARAARQAGPLPPLARRPRLQDQADAGGHRDEAQVGEPTGVAGRLAAQPEQPLGRLVEVDLLADQ